MLDDLGTDVAVRVTATQDGESGSAVSARSATVSRATLDLEERPAISGTRRYLHRLEASVPRWRQGVEKVRYRGCVTARRSTVPPAVATPPATATSGTGSRCARPAVKEGFRNGVTTSTRTKPVGHRVPLRRTVYYHVETRGRIVSSLADFRRLGPRVPQRPAGLAGHRDRASRRSAPAAR